MTVQTGLAPRRLSDRPESELLAPGTGMGAVTIRVADLDAQTAFYRDGVRLTVLEHHAGGLAGPARVVLGRLATPVVVLEHAPQLSHAGPREAGLYHVAVVFQRRGDLAASLYSTATHYPGSFVGSSDHFVSEAFYFTDPEGNGVELYWDRARTDWGWVDGRIRMGGSRLDPNDFLRRHLTEVDAAPAGAAAGTSPLTSPAKVGHVHLSVGDLDVARAFYVDRLGFEVVAEMAGQGLFVSAGGYHHHMAMNTWNSRGAGHRLRTLGLGMVRVGVPGADDLAALDERLHHHGIHPGHDGASLHLADPWGNAIEVTAALAAAPEGTPA